MNLNNSTKPLSEQDCAQTPVWFVDAVQRFTGLEIELDVCAAPNTAKCKNYLALEDGNNAFKQSWSLYNWCNPPYSDVTPWIHKAAGEAMSGSTTIMLIPDKPEVGYTRLARQYADTVIHMPFRLSFLRPDGSDFLGRHGKKQGAKFPVCVYVFTPLGINLPIRDVYHDFRID